MVIGDIFFADFQKPNSKHKGQQTTMHAQGGHFQDHMKFPDLSSSLDR